ncbi:MAG TPA: response regulator transcription factor [Chryseosolibacter sp.]
MQHGRNRLRILIIDDFSAIIDRISRLLNPSPWLEIANLKTTRDLEESVSVLQPHVVIMDLHVGNGATILEGVEAISRIKQSLPNVKVIVFTNFADNRYRELSFSNGADYFLDKAFDSDRLPEIILRIHNNIHKHK